MKTILRITAVSVTAGLDHSCAVSTSGYAYCRGNNDSYQVGLNNNDPQHIPAKITQTTEDSG